MEPASAPSDLPGLALQVVGSFLPARSVAACRLVSREWRAAFTACVRHVRIQRIGRALPLLATALTALTAIVLRELAAAVEPPPAGLTALAALPLLRSLTVGLVYGDAWRQLEELAEQLRTESEDSGWEGSDEEESSEEEEESSSEEQEGSSEGGINGEEGGRSQEVEQQQQQQQQQQQEEREAGAAEAEEEWEEWEEWEGGEGEGGARHSPAVSRRLMSRDVALLGGRLGRGGTVCKVLASGALHLDPMRPLDLFSGFAPRSSSSEGGGGGGGSADGGRGGGGNTGVVVGGGAAAERAKGGAAARGGGLTHLDVSFIGAGLLPGAWYGIMRLGASLQHLALRVGRCAVEERLVSRTLAGRPHGDRCWSPHAFAVDSLDALPHLHTLILDAPLTPRLARRLRERALPQPQQLLPPPQQQQQLSLLPPPPQQQQQQQQQVLEVPVCPLRPAAPVALQLRSLHVFGLRRAAPRAPRPGDAAPAVRASRDVPAGAGVGAAAAPAPPPGAPGAPQAPHPPPPLPQPPPPPCLTPSPPLPPPPAPLRCLTLDGDLAWLMAPEPLRSGAASSNPRLLLLRSLPLLAELRLAHRPAGLPAERWLPLAWQQLPAAAGWAGLRVLGLEGFDLQSYDGAATLPYVYEGQAVPAPAPAVRIGNCDDAPAAAGAAAAAAAAAAEGVCGGVDHGGAAAPRAAPAPALGGRFPHLASVRLRHCAVPLEGLAAVPLAQLEVLGCWLLAASHGSPDLQPPPPPYGNPGVGEGGGGGGGEPEPSPCAGGGAAAAAGAAGLDGAGGAGAGPGEAGAATAAAAPPWDAAAQLRLLRRQPWAASLLRLDLQLSMPPLRNGGGGDGEGKAEGSPGHHEHGAKGGRGSLAPAAAARAGASSSGASGAVRRSAYGVGACTAGHVRRGMYGDAWSQLEHLSITWEAAALVCTWRDVRSSWGPPAPAPSAAGAGPGAGGGVRHAPPAARVALGLRPHSARWVLALPALRSLELCLGDRGARGAMRVEEVLWLLRLRSLRRLRLVLAVSEGVGRGGGGGGGGSGGDGGGGGGGGSDDDGDDSDGGGFAEDDGGCGGGGGEEGGGEGEGGQGAAAAAAAARRRGHVGASGGGGAASAWLHSELTDLLLTGLPYCQSHVVQVRVP
ncbi:hypothetical protein TSOC_000152 [Tetrabaena socialis]|uniref:F-box domain-containing protein n=1 Tax=Tetrabaena socialis TaxID=47790 RepID=A0A2J8AK92_9CHLO|nr:hypothetical protein TSOC_000152 [Tetrabaena socialis]|eukprot:PNH12930.1 hypothetical protein TSOC_000152 [Tetrabaena socialis]